jgi:hypothetical protein
MSIEQLLFVLLVVAIPLLERLIRTMRARTNDSSAERPRRVAEPTVSRSRPPVSPHDASGTASEGRRTELPLAPSPLPPTLPRVVRRVAPEHVRASEREPRVRRQGTRGTAASLRTRHSERAMRPGTGRYVIEVGDLRRAIVLIAILGPCRALEPTDC